MAIDSVARGSVLQQGLTGMQQSHRQIVKAADEIVKAGTIERENDSIVDIAEPLIDMKMQHHIFDASAKVVKVADKTLGALLDIEV